MNFTQLRARLASILVTTILVSFDIDGTMEFGEPPGPVPASVVRDLVARGYVIGCASDWPRSSQQPLWARHGIEPHFVGGKHQLHLVREQFEADRYLHVGTPRSTSATRCSPASSSCTSPTSSIPVVADSIHEHGWAPA